MAQSSDKPRSASLNLARAGPSSASPSNMRASLDDNRTKREQVSNSSVVSIRNGVITGLLVAAIGGLVPTSRPYVIGTVSWLWRQLVGAWNWLCEPHAVWGWLLFLLTTLAVTGVGVLLRLWRENAAASIQPHLQYVQDYMFGALWRWKWHNNQVVSITGFCPSCDGTLVYSPSNPVFQSFGDAPYVTLHCENCRGKEVSRFDGGGVDYALSAVGREIERRVRTGEYSPNTPS